MNWVDRLRQLHACSEAVEWARTQPDLETAWENCERGDWMLWIAGRDAGIEQGNDRHIRLCYAVCLIWWELAYPYWYEYGEVNNDHRPEVTIERLESFCKGAAGAAGAAWSAWAAGAAGAAGAARAADAVWAARAADAVWAAGAARAEWAADAVWAAGAARAEWAEWAASLRRIAEIIREMCEVPVLSKGEEL
jgi:hypothetical protein